MPKEVSIKSSASSQMRCRAASVQCLFPKKVSIVLIFLLLILVLWLISCTEYSFFSSQSSISSR